jgi:hypothetical protein
LLLGRSPRHKLMLIYTARLGLAGVHRSEPGDGFAKREDPSADAVFANSGHEPFGLVGLETMAAGGVACTGCSGEDYAIPGYLVTHEDTPPSYFRTLWFCLQQTEICASGS